jgi:signal transduction histidine kinase
LRRRLLVSTALIALAAVLVLGLPLGLVGSRLPRADDEQRLEREADAAAGRIAQTLAAGERVDAATLTAMASAGHRLEVVLSGGRRIAGGAGIDDPHPLRVQAGSDAGARVLVVAPSSDRTAETGAVWLAVIVLSLLAVAVAVALALLQGRRLARPLERLAGQAGRIGRHVPATSGTSGIEEVDRVSDALADAGGRVADALRREREFSANASHQLRSPLTALRMRPRSPRRNRDRGRAGGGGRGARAGGPAHGDDRAARAPARRRSRRRSDDRPRAARHQAHGRDVDGALRRRRPAGVSGG